MVPCGMNTYIACLSCFDGTNTGELGIYIRRSDMNGQYARVAVDGYYLHQGGLDTCVDFYRASGKNKGLTMNQEVLASPATKEHHHHLLYGFKFVRDSVFPHSQDQTLHFEIHRHNQWDSQACIAETPEGHFGTAMVVEAYDTTRMNLILTFKVKFNYDFDRMLAIEKGSSAVKELSVRKRLIPAWIYEQAEPFSAVNDLSKRQYF